jgi:RNA processing factor Prp31
MIIQAIGHLDIHCILPVVFAALLDELDKELNTYVMRVREWSASKPEKGSLVAGMAGTFLS